MHKQLTVAELEKRWDEVLLATQVAVSRYPETYRELKSLVGDIVDKPLDIRAYMPTVEKLAGLLKTMDPMGRGSIFYIFIDRIAPNSIWQVALLRMECKDMLDHLSAFERWRLKGRRLKAVK